MMQARAQTRESAETEARSQAHEAAQEAGLSLADWLDSVVAAHAKSLGVDPRDFGPDQRREIIASKLARLGTENARSRQWNTLQSRSEHLRATVSRRQWRDRSYDPIDARTTGNTQLGVPRRSPAAPSQDPREAVERDSRAEAELAGAMDQRGRQAREQEAKTAEALADVTRWIRRGDADAGAERGWLDVVAERLAQIEGFISKHHGEVGTAPCRAVLEQLQQRIRAVAQEHPNAALPPSGRVHILHDLSDRLTGVAGSLQQGEDGSAPHDERLGGLAEALAGVLASFERRLDASKTIVADQPPTTGDGRLASEPAASLTQATPADLTPGRGWSPAPRPATRRPGLDQRISSFRSIDTAVAEIAKRQRDLDSRVAVATAGAADIGVEETTPRGGAAAPAPAPSKEPAAAIPAEVQTFDQRLGKIAHRIEGAIEKVGAVGAPASEVEAMRRDIAQISHTVSALTDSSHPASFRSLDALEGEVAKLTHRLERMQFQEPASGSGALRDNAGETSHTIAKPASAEGGNEVAPAALLRGEGAEASHEPSAERVRLRQDANDGSAGAAAVLPVASTAAAESALREASSRIEAARFESGHADLPQPVQQLADARRPSPSPEDEGQDTLEAIDSRIRQIGERLEQMSRQELDAGTVARIHEQTREIRDLLASAAQHPTPVEQIEMRIAALGDRLEQVASDTLRRPAPDGAPSRAEEIRTLLQDMAPAAAVAALEGRFESLVAKIDEVLARAGTGGAIDALNERVERIHQSLQTNAPADTHSLEALVRRLTDSMERMQSGDHNAQGVEALEAQIGKILARLDESNAGVATLGALERAVGELFGKLEETRLAAESAARSAVREGFDAGASRSAPPQVDVIGRELVDLRAMHDESDRRIRATLMAVHETLEKVVGRLAGLDDELQGPLAKTSRQPQPPQDPRAAALAAQRGDAVDSPPPLTRPAVPQAFASALSAKADGAPNNSAPKPDFLIEPGAAVPWKRGNGNANTSRKERENSFPLPSNEVLATKPALTEPDKAPPSANFIAAARRAAQAAAVESAVTAAKRPRPAAADAVSAPSSATGNRSADQIKTFITAKKRPILLALAGLVALVGAYEVVRTATTPNNTVEPATKRPPPAEAKKPAPKPRSDAAEPASSNRTAAVVGGTVARPVAPLDTTPTASLPPPARAVLPLHEAAQAGEAGAQYEMGVRLSEGRQMPRDLAGAARWFEKAAAQGLAPAQYRLGALYEKGTGVPLDLNLALAWYQRAASAGNARAMHNLAVITAEGGGGKPNYGAAVSWFRKAAELGVRDSQYNLAILTARGLGTAQDLPESYMWFALAAQQGDADAAKKRDEVAKQLDAVSLASAHAKVDSFKTVPPNRAANVVSSPPGGWEPAPRLQRGVQMPRPRVSSL